MVVRSRPTNRRSASLCQGKSPDETVAVTPDGSTVYVANQGANTVSVIATASNTVTATIAVGSVPLGVAASPDGSTVYVTNFQNNTVSVIATASNMVLAVIPVGSSTPPPEGGGPNGVAVSPDGSTVYVANFIDGTVSVIATATDTVTATIPVGSGPLGVAVTPDGSTVYVTNFQDNTVSVIATASNTVTATIPLGNNPFGVAVTPDGSTVYVANESRDLGREQRAAGTMAGTVSVIATASNTVTATIPGFSKPIAFGVFIGPPPVLATPPSGTACNGCSTAPSRAR